MTRCSDCCFPSFSCSKLLSGDVDAHMPDNSKNEVTIHASDTMQREFTKLLRARFKQDIATTTSGMLSQCELGIAVQDIAVAAIIVTLTGVIL